MTIVGDGTESRDFTFVIAVVDALVAALGHESSVQGVMSFRTWQDIAQKRFGWDV